MVETKTQPLKSKVTSTLEVAIVGAGPYGLSIAAHLESKGSSYAIFGKPMHTWEHQMPKGMHLKSEGVDSSLYDPGGFTLEKFCKENNLAYAPADSPVELDTFVNYGKEFQRRTIKQNDQRLVTNVDQSGDGFILTLEDGEKVQSKKVVLATGIALYANLPEMFDGVPGVSHSIDHADLSSFNGRDVIVIGRGASAIDLAVLLHEAGASVQAVTRSSYFKFASVPGTEEKASIFTRIRKLANPYQCMPGFRGFMYEMFPGGYRRLPKSKRDKILKSFVGPGGGWFMKERFMDLFPAYVNRQITAVTPGPGKVVITLASPDGSTQEICAEHVIAATGFKIDVKKMAYLNPSLAGKIRTFEGGAPILSAHLETSVPNLYLVGPGTAPNFGPVMRFACGARFTTARIMQRL
jgi:thioredoxin reductase